MSVTTSASPSFVSTAGLLWTELVSWYSSFVRSLPNLFVAATVITAFWFGSSFASRAMRRFFERTSQNNAIHDLLTRLVRIFLFCVGAFIALGVLDLQKTVTSLLAGAGVLGLVLGIAFQDIAANFFAGILISFRRPYAISDEVKIGSQAGEVVAINLRNTVLKDFDGSQILVPNRKVVENVVVNRTRYGAFRLTVEIRIAFSDDARKLKDVLIPEIQRLEGVLQSPPVSIDFEQFAENSQKGNLRVWIVYTAGNTPSNSMRDRVFLRTAEVLRQCGYTVPPMQQVVWDPNDRSSKQLV